MKLITSSIYTFEKLRTGNYLYVDKTEFIWQIASPPGGCFFLSRPRRFGKSLTISTLKAFFQGKRELFQGLYIDAQDYDWKPWPVIHLDLGSCGASNAAELREYLLFRLNTAADSLGVTLKSQTPYIGFEELITTCARQAPVVILIDEYDKPLLDNIGKPEVDALRDELERFYGVIKTTESLQRFVFITGVAKFTKVSVFSKLNHLNDITQNGRYALMFGYTQAELEENFSEYITEAAQKQNLSREELLTRMRLWYNGYRFHKNMETIYNPVSIAQFFLNDGEFKNYWFETGSPKVLFRLAEKWDFDFEAALTQPLQELEFSQFDVDKLQPMPLLLQTGYLTIRKAITGLLGTSYYLGFPNFEVESAFAMFLLGEYLPDAKPLPVIQRLRDTLSAGDLENFIAELNALLGAIPWRLHIKHEFYYHTVTFIALRLAELSARAEESVHAGDIDSGVTIGDTVYLFEFKLNKSAAEAIAQLKKKNYAAKYQTSGKRVILFGINFDAEKRQIDDWKTEQYK